MNSFPLPAVAAAAVAVVALPFSAAAAGTLLLTAGLGAIIHADYARRRVRLPRRAPAIDRQSPVLRREAHRLAA